MHDRPGSLVIVATPIGNLADLSPRAAQALRDAALIAAEDTRRVAKLLRHAGITTTRIVVANDHTELLRIPDVLDTLAGGGDVALVSDAGTPGISDPGERIVRAVLDAGYAVTTVPGPVAAVAALVISGLSTARFVFEGFLPRSGAERTRRLAVVATEQRTVVLYEAPHRVARTIADLTAACGQDRQVVVARELTKLYEEVQRGPLGEIDVGTPRGEYVIVLDGAPSSHEPPGDDIIRRALRHELDRGVGTKEAAATVAERYGIPKRTAYSLAIGTLTKR